MKATFPLILKFVFAGLLVFAVLVFAGLIPKPSDPPEEGEITGTVTIWGTFPVGQMTPLISRFFESNNVVYIQKDEATFDSDLVEAIATRRAPDLILMPQELILKRKRSIYKIPFQNYSERQFKTTFLSQGEIFLTPDGILALPFYIDPMILYWNHSIFADAGLVRPPENWSDVVELVSILTRQKDDGTILQATVSFGEYRNVTHAKDILAMLVLQNGNPIIRITEKGVYPTLTGIPSLGIPSIQSPLRFYTNFSNPRLEEYYTWNRGLSKSQQMFLNQNLAMYFGFASEYGALKKKNPLLDFGVTTVPQVKEAKFDATFGRIFGVAIVRTSDNIQSAFRVALALSSKSFSQELSKEMFLPPVRRDLYQELPNDAVRSVFYQSAIISRGWRDPNPEETSRIFRNSVESIITGESSVSEVVSNMQNEFKLLLKRTLNL